MYNEFDSDLESIDSLNSLSNTLDVIELEHQNRNIENKEKNLLFGDYSSYTLSTKFSSFRRKQKRSNKKKRFKLKKILSFFFKKKLKFINSFYKINYQEISNFSSNYSKFTNLRTDIINLKQLIKLFLDALCSFKKVSLKPYFLRFFLNYHVKIISKFETKLKKNNQKLISKAIKKLRAFGIFPTITSVTIKHSDFDIDDFNY